MIYTFRFLLNNLEITDKPNDYEQCCTQIIRNLSKIEVKSKYGKYYYIIR